MADLYSITVKYEMRHTRGELVPSTDEVCEAIHAAVKVDDELHVHVEYKGPVVVEDDFTGEKATVEKTFIEGCRVAVDEVEVQEARQH